MDLRTCPECGHDMDAAEPVYCGQCCNPECPCDEDPGDED